MRVSWVIVPVDKQRDHGMSSTAQTLSGLEPSITYAIVGRKPASFEPHDDCRLTAGKRQRIEQFIEANLDRQLTVLAMASRLGMSASYFTRAFSATLKVTPHSYLMLRRLHKARELLLSSSMRLADIALVTGFCDQSHLTKRFRANIGISPSAFRRQHREKRAP